jgi:hypothetical protein
LLVVVAIFDQAKLQAITGLQIMNWWVVSVIVIIWMFFLTV